ncbi:CpsD/CapB family tyrosine-protein kinase [Knoellia subterranea]|uniref:Protein-tyrosine kinase n=1 Tax=Knoellia subterranea KCTC 19937 TaxID=1385521 RepID=A0A0A0JTY0_9MICO|nr:CpsD/CapB family tyrosine-protein kinase [Knoellia subterranea]KGN39131.1 protein-tyrosine kinase [Knoellia subterranea KCTC 19937]
MTLQDYFKVFRHRWIIIVICALVAGAITWFITPASSDTTKKVGSYTATATMLVTAKASSAATAVAPNLDRVALYLKTGEVPKRAAKKVGYEGDPAVLASGLTVVTDPAAQAITVAATASDGKQAAAVANAFANETINYIKEKPRAGVENARLEVLQTATPIPTAGSDGGFVIPPGRGPRTAIATLLGVLVGLGLALLLDRLDSRLRTRSEIHNALQMPIIAEVPRLKRAQRSRASIAVATDPLSIYSDGYRAARTALVHTTGQVMPGDYTPRRAASEVPEKQAATGARLIVVTSAHAAEGKTTSVANLAASFAETGQRVLVLDADLRSPDVHNVFDVPQGAGISDYLSDVSGDASLASLMRPTSVPGVRIMSAGSSLAHPAALASRMSHLLDEARGMADVVLIDTAPLLEASDVFDILPMVDTLLLVVRSGRLTEVAGNRVAELVGRFQVPVSGVLIVGAPTKRADAYGYGYGDDRMSKRKAKRARKGARSRQSGPVGPPTGHMGDFFDDAEQPESRRSRRTSSSA